MTERSLPDWLAYLEQLHPTAIDMGLDRVRQVAERMGLRRPAGRVVTVTGTNGKGSTCAFLAELLLGQGLRVGVYASPHLLRYNERVVIDRQQATDAELCAAFAVVESARQEISLTYFEMGTLAAFWLFQQAALDFAVLEVGLGGRLDAVNLIDADLAIVTSIALDHADWLGDTRESVAVEKAGIFRPGIPVVCGDLDPPAVLLQQAAVLAAPFYLRGRDFDLALTPAGWHWQGLDRAGQVRELHDLPLLDLPLENAALALQAFSLLDLGWQPAQLSLALQRTRLSGRLERHSLEFQGKRLSLLLDVGHNPHACEFLARRLRETPLAGRRLAVFGLLADKDLAGVVQAIQAEISQWAVTALPSPRSRSALELHDELLKAGVQASRHGSIGEALEAQCRQAAEGDEVLVFGSFYCVAEALAWLAQRGAGNGCTG
ncbi:bifunctional tetrahydrofolate synthase/dihydrofolate synthase [Pseudomonas sp. N040]|uniref:bifunctional tetrahydrofolate synthase/dihydrofolate synthase n=1 Tax=Pseudomonas sp. N040 TaxID=2785325 RepID=UPI0018A318A5|nr:bifunctional tetrahydrofolate synthase/dihydrofolate synthase [Pseudomonas sp. N040]MBF7729176.1 bifunctional tetrahydrofolate synthase/dihydrofolate synthase [Pseudomonas sp. N040]MBW7012816.1 bifunctional tetrahydrofolate synthase/dihydrofolate synthase [Pseudomonas sp. N040]